MAILKLSVSFLRDLFFLPDTVCCHTIIIIDFLIVLLILSQQNRAANLIEIITATFLQVYCQYKLFLPFQLAAQGQIIQPPPGIVIHCPSPTCTHTHTLTHAHTQDHKALSGMVSQSFAFSYCKQLFIFQHTKKGPWVNIVPDLKQMSSSSVCHPFLLDK